MEAIKLVVLIPVGPDCNPTYIEDTLESVCHYTTGSRKIIILDDSGKRTWKSLKRNRPDLVVLNTPDNYGKDAGLYLNLSQGFRFAHENYDFDVLLRMDTDALVIGGNPEDDAIAYFLSNPECGIIGSFKTDCNGDPRDFREQKEQFEQQLNYRSLWSKPEHLPGIVFCRNRLRKAKKNGYELGEHCMGGSYFISPECIRRLYRNNLLARQEIRWCELQEDWIFGLLIYSVGLKHGDFATGHFPMGLRWRGLPCSPEELLTRKKKLAHSTRFYRNLSEEEIRGFFRGQRRREPTTS
jgi:hypothetical protein